MTTTLETYNKSIVERWIDEVFNRGEMASVDDLKVSSYLDWTPLPAPYQDVDLPVSGIKAALPDWLESLPDFEFTADRLIADGDFVVCLGHWDAHHAGDYKGHSPTNMKLGGTRIDIFRIAGDKMVEHWGCGNELAFLQMVGALEPSDAPQTDEDVARRFVEAILNRRDLGAIADLVSPGAIDHSGQALSMLNLLTGFGDLEATVLHVSADDGEIIVTSQINGTHEGIFMGIEPTGKQVLSTRVDRFKVVDGKITEAWCDSGESELAKELLAVG